VGHRGGVARGVIQFLDGGGLAHHVAPDTHRTPSLREVGAARTVCVDGSPARSLTA
jgi:hypothetical protein